MPKVSRTGKTVRCKLETAPPDGFVVLKKLTWGQTLERQDMSLTAEGTAADGNRSQRRAQTKDNSNRNFRLRTSVTKVIEYEFANCIVDHNLTDENDRKYDFSDPKDVADLDPKTGGEISELIDSLNEGEDMAPFEIGSSSSSPSPTGQTAKSPTG